MMDDMGVGSGELGTGSQGKEAWGMRAGAVEAVEEGQWRVRQCNCVERDMLFGKLGA